MRAVKHPGECRLCGKFKELTFEHVPPEKAFNSSSIKLFPFEETLKTITGAESRMPWDFTNLKGKIQQRGSGGYYLCRECNNNTGSWYIKEYNTFVQTLHRMIQIEQLEPGNCFSFTLSKFYPLRIFKAAMTLFCDINQRCFGDSKLKEFLLEKENSEFNEKKYSLYMYLVSPAMSRINGLAAQMNLNTKDSILVTEIASYPVGFALYLDKPDNYPGFGLCINDFAKFNYQQKCKISFSGVPYIDINTQMPIDYRSKSEIIECIEANIKH